VHGRDVRKKRRTTDYEREYNVGLLVYVIDQQVEQDDGVLRLVTEWPVGRGRDGKGTCASGIWISATAETDDRGARSERREVERA